MANLQFPISPLPKPEQAEPFKIPEQPDASALIMFAAELRQKEEVLKQKKVSDFMSVIQGFADLAQRSEETKAKNKMASAVLGLRTDAAKRSQERLELYRELLGSKPPIGEEKRISSETELDKLEGGYQRVEGILKNLPEVSPNVKGPLVGYPVNFAVEMAGGAISPEGFKALQEYKVLKPQLASQARRLFAETDARMSDTDQKYAMAAQIDENIDTDPVKAAKLLLYKEILATVRYNIQGARTKALNYTPKTLNIERRAKELGILKQLKLQVEINKKRRAIAEKSLATEVGLGGGASPEEFGELLELMSQ